MTDAGVITNPILFIKALGIGMAIAAPVGPMSVLCMRTTLARGARHGLAIGCGIAIGDGLYATVAALGLTSLSRYLLLYERQLDIAAGLVLIYIGLKSFWAKIDWQDEEKVPSTRWWGHDVLTAMLLTLANPPTIISFAAVLTALMPVGEISRSATFATVGGVFTGSLLWWCTLVSLVGGLRHAIGRKARIWSDRISGVLMAGLGAAELARAIIRPS